MIIVTNADSVEHTWVGQAIEPNATYTVQPAEQVAWSNDSILLTAVANGQAVLSDGTTTYQDVNQAINFLKGIAKKSANNALVVDTSLSTGIIGAISVTTNTHDWGDRTTWYQKSVQVTSETLTDSGDGLTFNSANPNWVNMDNVKLTYNYNAVPERDGSMSDRSTRRPLVSVAGVQLNDPTVRTTPGYTVNYAAGTVTFGSSQSGKAVQVTYWHNNGIARCSEWILNPPPSYAYLIDYIELQFSQSVTFTTPLHFECWAGGTVTDYADFDMTLYNAGYGQYQGIYRGAQDLLNFCTNRSSQIIPAFGGLAQQIIIFPFDYLIQANLLSSEGIILMSNLENDIPYTGAELATATFYMQLVPETSL